MTIVIVCVAGVSGTFLSLRLRTAGISDPIRVTGLGTLVSDPPAPSDLVLVAPQIAVSMDRVRAAAGDAPVLELTAEELGLRGAGALVARVRDALAARAPSAAGLDSARLDTARLDSAHLEGEIAP